MCWLVWGGRVSLLLGIAMLSNAPMSVYGPRVVRGAQRRSEAGGGARAGGAWCEERDRVSRRQTRLLKFNQLAPRYMNTQGHVPSAETPAATSPRRSVESAAARLLPPTPRRTMAAAAPRAASSRCASILPSTACAF